MLHLYRPACVRTFTQRAMLSTRNSVVISGLPVSATDDLLRASIKEIEIKEVQLQRGCSLHFSNKEQAETWASFLSKKQKLKAETFSASLPCLNFNGVENLGDLSSTFEKVNIKPISIVSNDGVSKALFLNNEEAKKLFASAKKQYNITSQQQPTYVVQVSGLEKDMSVAQLLNDVNKELGKSADPILVNRDALVTFKRSHHIVGGIKQLKKLVVDGQNVKVQRKTSVELPKQIPSREEAFDEFSNNMFLGDNLSSDPAARYQILRNSFERALNDAMASKDASLICSHQHRDNAQALLDKLLDRPSKEAYEKHSRELFDMFMLRDDLKMFSRDFEELSSKLGEINESDSFNWTQFRMESNEDAEKLYLKAAELGEKALEKNVNNILGEESEKKVNGGVESKQKSTLLNPSLLRDADGRMWSGVILDTDMVQKTMPGNRVGTHRALVVVGNLRGTAGYGMGKGKTTGEALNAAFRAAQRNLLHVDLYENYGLAHDVHGKHNSCHAYIRATPRSRVMVASPFASAVLQRFGIGSASIKLVGRRDPYAMVRAIFDALSRHQNIDEYAKARGKRYLTQKWAHDNGL